MLTQRALALSAVLVVAACGRSSPQPAFGETQAEAAAKKVLAGSEDQLAGILDDHYLAADTPILDQAQVADIATQTCLDEDALGAILDNRYLPADTAVLNNLDIDQVVQTDFFDDETALHAALDDDYLPSDFVPSVNFDDLVGLPGGFADRVDNDTAPTGTSPVLVDAQRKISLDTTGCSTGQSYVFNGTNFSNSCSFPAAPRSLDPVGGVAGTGPTEALSLVATTDVSGAALTATAATVGSVYGAGSGPAHKLLIVDAWAVGVSGGNGTAAWHLAKGATAVTGDEIVPNTGDVAHITHFAGNAAARTINAGGTLDVVASDSAAGTVSFSVFVLAVPVNLSAAAPSGRNLSAVIGRRRRGARPSCRARCALRTRSRRAYG